MADWAYVIVFYVSTLAVCFGMWLGNRVPRDTQDDL
jgi:hypothetical protein